MKINPRQSARYATLEFLRLVIMAVALFGSVGMVDWWAA
jgi:hypothetical protein